jgi:hypothetical protein
MNNDIESLRVRATELGIKFSGNTGVATLQGKISAHMAEGTHDILGDNEPLPEIIKPKAVPKGPPSLAELQTMNPAKIDPNNQALIRQVVRAKALILRRVKITNLDPADAELHGAVITVMNKYTGKVSKFIPFGEGSENGYHIPQIILNQLQAQKFVIRKAKKGGQFGVKTYNTNLVPKYNIEFLPDLTPEELKNLADRQAASGTIGNDT